MSSFVTSKHTKRQKEKVEKEKEDENLEIQE